MPIGEAISSSNFHNSNSFVMTSGGHVDVAILGAILLAEIGVVANWAVSDKGIICLGGVIDLFVGVNKIIITMGHVSKDGTPKFVEKCSYPITSTRKADIIITDLAVFKWKDDQYELVELMGNTTLEEVDKNTTAKYKVSEHLL